MTQIEKDTIKALSRRSFIKLATTSAVVAGSIAGLSTISGCSPLKEAANQNNALRSATAFNFNTMITLQADCSQETLDEALERCNYFESIFSHTIDSSDIGKINTSQGAPVKVASETADIIARALEYSRATDGLFDISIGSVSSLWNFNEGIKPADSEISSAVAHVGWQNISVANNTVTLLDPETKLDLGGIAKGYIADNLASFFESKGCTSALINLGGNVYTVGTRPDGSPWNVGIQDPGVADSIIGTMTSADESTVASGMYEQNFEQDGVVYHHILDATTGYPSQSDIESVSVVSDKSIDGDVWATALFLMGSEQAYEVLESREDLSGLIVKRDGSILKSSDCPIEA